MKDLVKVLGNIEKQSQMMYAINFLAQKGNLEEFADWLIVNVRSDDLISKTLLVPDLTHIDGFDFN